MKNQHLKSRKGNYMIDITKEIIKEAQESFIRSDRIHEYNSYIHDAIILLSRCKLDENNISYHGIQKIKYTIDTAIAHLDSTPSIMEEILIQHIEDLEKQ